MLTRVWKTTVKFNKDARIEEHTYTDGSKHYSFRDRLGRPQDVEVGEIDRIIKDWRMKEIEL